MTCLTPSSSEVAADGQERQLWAIQLTDEPHVAKDGRVAGVIEAEAVLDLDNEAGRLAEVQRHPAVRVPVAGRVVGRRHRHGQAGGLHGAALVHARGRISATG